MTGPRFSTIPDWFSWDNQGVGVSVAAISRADPDLLILMVDNPDGANRGLYRVGRGFTAVGVTGSWTPWIDVPDWFSWQNQGADVAVADVTGSGRPDLIVLMVDSPPGPNRGLYRIGRDLDIDGIVTGGWSPWRDVPDWFSWDNQGVGVAVADINHTGKLDLIAFMIDNGPKVNRGLYRIGRDLDVDGIVTGGWSPWRDVPDWFSWDDQGGGIAVADLDGAGSQDIIAFGIDNPPGPFPAPSANPSGQNQAYYRIGRGLGSDGLAQSWDSPQGVNNWFSWENQYGSLTVAGAGQDSRLLVLAVDHPPAGNRGVYTQLALVEKPETHGRWRVLPFNSQILAVHAAVLPNSKVLFFAGSGNNPTREADPRFGDIAQHMWTSVVWDPAAPEGANFEHPATLDRADGHPFDFFCGGDTYLADGRLFSAGGTRSYNGGNNFLGQRDTAAFDYATKQWTIRARMQVGRWYPSLLTLPDGRILTVGGKNDSNGDPNLRIEIYDPAADAWQQLTAPHDPAFTGLPFYAHLFLLRDGRVFFDGGRMDDPSPQQAGILDLSADPIGFQSVGANVIAELRSQSSSVLLPPAQSQQVMIIGGGPTDDSTSATGYTERVDLTVADPAFTLAMPLSLPRMHLNAVLLPDRTVFISGGAIDHEEATTKPIPRLQSEIYDPPTDTWRPGASATVIRMYHSVALLLPDARVVTASGNPPLGDRVQLPDWVEQPNEELKLEVYEPPYLFAGNRPVIGGTQTEWKYGQPVQIATPDAQRVLWAELIRPGVTTHAFDNSQRLIDLPIDSTADSSIRISAPDSATVAPPGWYMLFLVDQTRVPSHGHWVHLTQ